MKWLDKFILRRAINVLNKYDENEKVPEEVDYDHRLHKQLNKVRHQLGSSRPLAVPTTSDEADFNHEHAMKFTVHPAQGGYIVELRVYNAKTDRHDQQLHLISDDGDLSDSIAKIMTMELLRR